MIHVIHLPTFLKFFFTGETYMAWCHQTTSHYLRHKVDLYLCCHRAPIGHNWLNITKPPYISWVSYGVSCKYFHENWPCYNSTLYCKFNSSPPSAAYMRQQAGSALVQIMAWCRTGSKPLPEPTLNHCQLDRQEQISVKFESKYKTFHSWKCTWKCRLWNGGHFVQGEIG